MMIQPGRHAVKYTYAVQQSHNIIGPEALDDLFQEAGWFVNSAKGEYGNDRIFTSRYAENLQVRYERAEYSRTHTAFLEVTNAEGSPGWALFNHADYILYYVPALARVYPVNSYNLMKFVRHLMKRRCAMTVESLEKGPDWYDGWSLRPVRKSGYVVPLRVLEAPWLRGPNYF